MNIFSVFSYFSLRSLFNIIYAFFTRSRNKDTTAQIKHHRNSMTVIYYQNQQKYKILIPKYSESWPDALMNVKDQDDRDVTETIKEYMGPMYDFHNVPATPRLLGYERLTFYFLLGDDKTFTGDEKICI